MKTTKLILSILIALLIIAIPPGCKIVKRVELESRIEELEEQLVNKEINEETAEESLEGSHEAEEAPDEVTRAEEEPAVEGEEPTISLAIYEGPTLSGRICYYRIEATVTGFPVPTIEWSKDDSLGAFSPTICQVNLTRGEEYVLNVNATNPVGSASDSIALAWGCGDLEVADEIIMEEDIATSTDPDITIESLIPEVFNGYIVGGRTDKPYVTGTFIVGDTEKNVEIYSYASFLIRDLPEGIIVIRAKIRIQNIKERGTASKFGPFVIYCGEEQIAAISTKEGLSEVLVSNDKIRDAIQDSIKKGYDGFHIRMKLTNISASNNGREDQFVYEFEDVDVIIEY